MQMMINMFRRVSAVVTIAVGLILAGPSAFASDTYSSDEIFRMATDFFGETTEGLASIVEKIFIDKGPPNGFIAGQEISGAFVIGLRYGEGTLNRKNTKARKIYWRGPSVGWDFGGNASKVFTLVYNIKSDEDIFQRFTGVDGSFYFIAGFGMNYQHHNHIVLAPIRTGVGLRAGANVGYLHYDREKGGLPF